MSLNFQHGLQVWVGVIVKLRLTSFVIVPVVAGSMAFAGPSTLLYSGGSCDGYGLWGVTSTVVNPVTLIASAGPHGSVTPDGTVAASYGVATNIVMADPGYMISSIQTNGVAVPSAEGAVIFTSVWQNASSPGVFTAAFTLNRFTGGSCDGYGQLGVTNAVANPVILIASAGPHGSVTPSGTVMGAYGVTTNIVTADSGYMISSIQTNGVAVPVAAGTVVFTSVWQTVSSPSTITVIFALNRFAGGACDGYGQLGVTNVVANPFYVGAGTVFSIR